MTKLASRMAGSRLMAILFVLLLPMSLLSFLTVRGMLQDISTANGQRVGVGLVERVMPILIERTSGRINIEQKIDLVTELGSASINIGSEAELKNFAEAVATGTQAESLVAMSTFLAKVGVRSGLLQDTNAETSYLSSVLTEHLPAVAVQLSLLNDQLYATMITLGEDNSARATLLLTLGQLKETIEQTAETIYRASNNGTRTLEYSTATRLINELRHAINALSTKATSEQPDERSKFMIALSDARNVSAQRFEKISEIHDFASQHLKAKFDERLVKLRSKLRNLVGVVLACVFLAVGGSFLLFRNTLKRLDQVDTDRKRAEAMGERVKAINEDLSRANRDLAQNMASLKLAQDELVSKRRMEQLGQLTATVAHEIRNPLGSVRTSAFLLEKKLANRNLGIESQLERINKGLVRCDNIITQLLDFSRTKVVQSKPEKLDDWLAALIEEEAQRLPQTVEVNCELGLGNLEVPIDGTRLQRAIINMINNAVEAMSSEAKSKGSDKPAILRVMTAVECEEVRVSVADNGPGIPAENMAKIREPLFTTKSFGTGLGIPAIEQIAVQHGGRLEITSTPGEGAKFTLCLPRHTLLDTAEPIAA